MRARIPERLDDLDLIRPGVGRLRRHEQFVVDALRPLRCGFRFRLVSSRRRARCWRASQLARHPLGSTASPASMPEPVSAAEVRGAGAAGLAAGAVLDAAAACRRSLLSGSCWRSWRLLPATANRRDQQQTDKHANLLHAITPEMLQGRGFDRNRRRSVARRRASACPGYKRRHCGFPLRSCVRRCVCIISALAPGRAPAA